MNRKRQRSKQLLKRREPNPSLPASIIENIFVPPAGPAQPSKELSPAMRVVLREMHLFRRELDKLFLRTRQRMLLIAAKEERITQ